MTPTNEAGHGLPELPEWSKRDDLGGLVPSQIRSELRAYARDALALSRGVPEGAGEPCPVAGTFACRCGKFTIPMDKGPWRVSDDGKDVFSDDFSADVALRISGDFIDDHHRKDYAEWLARTLNGAAAPAAAGAQGEVRKMQVVPQQQGSDLAWTRLETWLGTFADSIPNVAYHELCAIQKLIATTPQPAAADGGVRERARAVLADAQQRADGHGVNARLILDEGMSLRCNVACDVALRAIEAALSTHRQAGDDLSKFRELAERWRANGHPYVSDCADELMTMVEKGAGNG